MAEEEEEGEVPFELAQMTPYESGHAVPRWRQRAGNKADDVPIFSLQQPSMLHDFAITEHYAIFPESQLVMCPMNMALRGGSLIGLDSAMVDMIHINLRTGTVLRTALSLESLEFGVIHQGYVGRYNRYGYFGVSAPLPRFSGIRKLDFAMVGADDCTVARRDFGPGCFVGEPFFVPSNDNGDGNEDNGYVVCYTHKEDTGESQFVVMDAMSPELEIVAAVQLPARVPYGFHGRFITQAELLSQQK
uniref:Zeaxanthin cleavage oxygenase, putative n=1 Tax=Oryza sativa subsp. japonica TaxID=39947 RepID=Q33AP0_ORYSJ|nr:zeaxanthin cleavage oxygenase, putative [Oryza sativa Japonica Group]